MRWDGADLGTGTAMDVFGGAGRWFRGVNTLVEPVARRGWLAPAPLGAGLVVVDTVGRRSGRPRSAPVLAARIGTHLFVGTVRGSSHWMANLAEDPSPLVSTRSGPRPVDVEVRRVDRVGTLAVLRLVDDDET